MLVQAGIYDAFLERFTAAVEALTVADGFTEGVQVGPLIDEPALEKVESHVADALERRRRARRRAASGSRASSTVRRSSRASAPRCG